MNLAHSKPAQSSRRSSSDLYRELRGTGYSTREIINLSADLIDMVTKDLKEVGAKGPEGLPSQLAAV